MCGQRRYRDYRLKENSLGDRPPESPASNLCQRQLEKSLGVFVNQLIDLLVGNPGPSQSQGYHGNGEIPIPRGYLAVDDEFVHLIQII